MKNNFDLKKYLVENKFTRNSLNEKPESVKDYFDKLDKGSKEVELEELTPNEEAGEQVKQMAFYEEVLDSETAIKKFLGYLIKPETMRRVGNTGNFVAKTRTGKIALIEITPSGGGAIVYELDKEGKKLAKLDRLNWGYPSLDNGE